MSHLKGAKVLSNRALSFAYVHVADGKQYEHEFDAGVTVLLLKNGTVELTRHDGKPLWLDDRSTP